METEGDASDDVKAWIHSISLVSLIIFPWALLLVTSLEGRSAAQKQRKAEAANVVNEKKPDTGVSEPKWHAPQKIAPSCQQACAVFGKRGAALRRRSSFLGMTSVVLLLVCLAFTLRSAFCSYPAWDAGLLSSSTRDQTRAAASAMPLAGASASTKSDVSDGDARPDSSVRISGAVAAFGILGIVATLKSALKSRRKTSVRVSQPRAGVVSARRLVDAPAEAAVVPLPLPRPKLRHVRTPELAGYSLWHDVDLHVKSWLDEDTGLLRYVNEMPLGTLQKFEVQPDAPQNAIVEDYKSSKRLQTFGEPVPFNYGCFPQTYRDPGQTCSVYGAPGDDDPLDAIDLGVHPSEAGAVVQCRPLGAVCLIDEGKADWKVLVVNTQDPGPFAEARTVEDVERIMPGRLGQVFKWMDDFKNSAGKSTAKLQTEIHGPKWAKHLAEQDHACWKVLVAKTSPDGTSDGHWICAPKLKQPTQALLVKMGRMIKEPAPFVGAARDPAPFVRAPVCGSSP